MFRPCVTVRERSGGIIPPRGEALSLPVRPPPGRVPNSLPIMILKTFPRVQRQSLQDHARAVQRHPGIAALMIVDQEGGRSEGQQASPAGNALPTGESLFGPGPPASYGSVT
jgi:hypothetical protein